MLRTLEISDMLIIDRLDLEFQPGLNVLTGETGAGKSILLDALGFVLGWRGRADLVRQGAEQGVVVASFDLPAGHAAREILHEAGLPVEDELILRRINTADGRKTAWVNDRRCSGEVLRGLSDTLLELHGQHDDRGLLNPRVHLCILDTFGGYEDLRSTVRSAWNILVGAQRALSSAQDSIASIREEEEFLRHAVAELDQLAPQPGEEVELDTRRRLMQSAERIREDIIKAHGVLTEDGAEAAVSNAMRWLDGVADKAEGTLDEPLSALGRALNEVDEAVGGILVALDKLSFNPVDLDETEERLFAIRGLGRKHDVPPDELSVFADGLRGRLSVLDAGAADIAALKQAVTEAQGEYDQAAEALADARSAAALRLDKAVMEELAPLKMERAIFETKISEAQPGPDGRDEAIFTIATNPGAPSGPLNKIASGGELSRFLLALKVCLTQDQTGLTMIFDEIDRGVGGATADAVGRRLADLAENGQILVVTHSPQVAALGAHHWRVEKKVNGQMTTSNVVPLAPSDRIDEIARMLSGDTITDEARGAARALLQS
ncbi:MAG: DNA repair protein RecN [Pseudomonadota bacterium]